MLGRLVRAVVVGIVAGIITAVLVFVISALIPTVEIDASKWALIVGLLVGLYALVTNSESL